MSKCRSMYAGSSGINYGVNDNGPGNGNGKWQGLAPITNMRSSLIPYVRSHANGNSRDLVFCMNQLSTIGSKSTMFASNADGNIPDCIVTHSHKNTHLFKSALDNMYEKTPFLQGGWNSGTADGWNNTVNRNVAIRGYFLGHPDEKQLDSKSWCQSGPKPSANCSEDNAPNGTLRFVTVGGQGTTYYPTSSELITLINSNDLSGIIFDHEGSGGAKDIKNCKNTIAEIRNSPKMEPSRLETFQFISCPQGAKMSQSLVDNGAVWPTAADFDTSTPGYFTHIAPMMYGGNQLDYGPVTLTDNITDDVLSDAYGNFVTQPPQDPESNEVRGAAVPRLWDTIDIDYNVAICTGKNGGNYLTPENPVANGLDGIPIATKIDEYYNKNKDIFCKNGPPALWCSQSQCACPEPDGKKLCVCNDADTPQPGTCWSGQWMCILWRSSLNKTYEALGLPNSRVYITFSAQSLYNGSGRQYNPLGTEMPDGSLGSTADIVAQYIKTHAQNKGFAGVLGWGSQQGITPTVPKPPPQLIQNNGAGQMIFLGLPNQL